MLNAIRIFIANIKYLFTNNMNLLSESLDVQSNSVLGQLSETNERTSELEEVHQTTAERLDAHAKSLDEQLEALKIHADGITNNEDNLNKAEKRIGNLKNKTEDRVNSLNYLLNSTAQRMNEIGEIQGELADRISYINQQVASTERTTKELVDRKQLNKMKLEILSSIQRLLEVKQSQERPDPNFKMQQKIQAVEGWANAIKHDHEILTGLAMDLFEIFGNYAYKAEPNVNEIGDMLRD